MSPINIILATPTNHPQPGTAGQEGRPIRAQDPAPGPIQNPPTILPSLSQQGPSATVTLHSNRSF